MENKIDTFKLTEEKMEEKVGEITSFNSRGYDSKSSLDYTNIPSGYGLFVQDPAPSSQGGSWREETRENTKYYTPSLEEIGINYECEFYSALEYGGYKWLPWTFTKQHVLAAYVYNPKKYTVRDGPGFPLEGTIRTPYLRKEDIEKCGWLETDTPCFFDRKNNTRFYLSWYPETNRVEFGDEESEVGFAGECKSINELKLVMKFLNIK